MTKEEIEYLTKLSKEHPQLSKLLKEYNETQQASIDKFNSSIKNMINGLSNEIDSLSGKNLIKNTEDRIFERVMMVIDKVAKVKEALGEDTKRSKSPKNDDGKVIF